MATGGIGKQSAVFDCPHCHVNNCQHTFFVQPARAGEGRRTVKRIEGGTHSVPTVRRHLVYVCSHCGGTTYFLDESWDVIHGQESTPIGMGGPGRVVVRAGSAVLHQHPVGSPAIDPAVPPQVRAAAEEAEKCLAVGALNACGVMTRRAIDALCLDKKAVGTTCTLG